MKVVIEKHFGKIGGDLHEQKDVEADVYVIKDFVTLSFDDCRYYLPKEIFTGIFKDKEVSK